MKRIEKLTDIEGMNDDEQFEIKISDLKVLVRDMLLQYGIQLNIKQNGIAILNEIRKRKIK